MASPWHRPLYHPLFAPMQPPNRQLRVSGTVEKEGMLSNELGERIE
jgi:hypothetical protein